MTLREIANKIMWSTIEDYVGIWELEWELNSLCPEKKQFEKREIIKKILSIFSESKLINWYQCNWGTEEIICLANEEAAVFIKDNKYWLPPAVGELCIKIGSTETGEEYYNNGKLDELFYESQQISDGCTE